MPLNPVYPSLLSCSFGVKRFFSFPNIHPFPMYLSPFVSISPRWFQVYDSMGIDEA